MVCECEQKAQPCVHLFTDVANMTSDDQQPSCTPLFFFRPELTSMCETENYLTGFHLFFITVAISFGLTRILNGVTDFWILKWIKPEMLHFRVFSSSDLTSLQNISCFLTTNWTFRQFFFLFVNGIHPASHRMDWKVVPGHLCNFLSGCYFKSFSLPCHAHKRSWSQKTG